jgi:hypothetical protein
MPPEKSQRELPEPSYEFIATFTHSGSNHVSCEFCKRVHYSPSSDFDWEDGELEELNELNRKNPDKYIAHEEDSIRYGVIDGKQFVDGCPCNSVSLYERLIIANRYQIIDFLQVRAEKIARESEQESGLVKKASVIPL